MLDQKKEGMLADGSHLILEIIDRDNAKTRKRLKEIKENFIKEMRQKEMKADMQVH